MKYKYTLEGNTNVSFKIMFLFYLHLTNKQPENSNLKSTATKYICDNLLLKNTWSWIKQNCGPLGGTRFLDPRSRDPN